MENVVAVQSRLPQIREFTASLCRGLPNNAIRQQVDVVANFVKDNVTYIRDPAGSEYLITPDRMLSGYFTAGYMAGDCDDHVMLLNTMLGTIGIPSKCVGVKFGNSPDYNHVISGISCCNTMVLIDPCAKGVAQPVYNDLLII